MNHITNLQRPVLDLQATGRKIKSFMDASQISVRDLQSIFGFDYPQAIYAWLSGRNLPTVDNLIVLSELFGVSIDEIVCRKFITLEAESKVSA